MRKGKSVADVSNVEVWATAVSTNADNGRRVMFRFAKEFSPSFDKASQPDRIIIVWRYESETGQPTSDVHQQMILLEDSIEAILRQDSLSTLALVSTGENLREWIYYSRSEEEFLDRFNLALIGLPIFPIEVHTASDPAWLNYEQFKSGLKKM
jgi:hypothetical protein